MQTVLGVQLAVSKLLWELRAGRLQQAIPLCLSFCLSVLNSPSALIHSHIQFSALSIHQSPHFVSADFILTLTIAHCRHPGGPPPAAASLLRDLLTRAQLATCRFLLHRPAKTLILNLIPIVLLFTFSIQRNERKNNTRREGETEVGGRETELGRGGGNNERDVC